MTLHLSLQSKLRAKLREMKTNPILSPWSVIPLIDEAAKRLDELEAENAQLRLHMPHHEVKENHERT